MTEANVFRKTLANLGSMRVTIVLLVFSMMLTFLATMAQTQIGIWEVMDRYIRTWFVWHEVPGVGVMPVFPGGWILGGLLFVNIVTAHLGRFRWQARRIPLLLIHGGIALLLVAEWITGVFAREMNLVLHEGQTRGYTEHPRETEFVLIDRTDPDKDRVYAVHESHLAEYKPFEHPELPVRVKVRHFFQNSRVFLLPQESVGQHPGQGAATHGIGPRLRILEEPRVVSTDGRNVVSAVVDVIESSSGRLLGQWAVSSVITDPQEFHHEGRVYRLALRPQREYLGYRFQLEYFDHRRHPGTEIPKHFSSRVRLINPSSGEDREVLISMNQPLRYQGRTFYQASYADNDTTSILQVVRNPGWTLPYLACGMVSIGLLWQLASGLARRRSGMVRSPNQEDKGGIRRAHANRPTFTILGILLIFILPTLWLLTGVRPSAHGPKQPNLDDFGALPVLADGRVKAMDSMARGYLRALSGKTSIHAPDGKRLSAIEWLLTVLAKPDLADQIPVFTVFHPDVMGMLGREADNRLQLTFNDLRIHGAEIQHHAEHAREKDRAERSSFESAVLQLDYLITLYWRLRHSLHIDDPAGLAMMVHEFETEVHPRFIQLRGMPDDGVPDSLLANLHQSVVRYGVLDDFAQFAPVPYRGGTRGEWVTIGEAFQRSLRADALHPAVLSYRDILLAWTDNNADDFNHAVAELRAMLDHHFQTANRRAAFENTFNRMSLFSKGATLYVVGFLLVCLYWMLGSRLRELAVALIALSWVAHSAGLMMRMIIQERPPVTSLHASAVFVGWAAVLLSFFVERRMRNGLGIAGGATLGFLTLVIAHNLAGDGDTIEVMRAVLDSNFWLATHVVVITIGYAAVYVAGALGAAYLIMRLIPNANHPGRLRTVCQTALGVVGFALLFSFAGTVLGGIWADQSWGRFWGWDPKENGALLIVLWMAVILHLRIGGLATDKWLMAGTVFGNIIVAFSWFGVNMLGVGLHSYGFMEGAPFWLGLFMTSQLLLIGLALMPENQRAAVT